MLLIKLIDLVKYNTCKLKILGNIGKRTFIYYTKIGCNKKRKFKNIQK